jgi:hypothetical protein
LPGNFNRFQRRLGLGRTFDCDAACRDELTGTLRGWFGKWLESLQ